MPDRSVAPAAPIAPIRRNRAPVLAGVVGKMVLKEVRNQAESNRCRLTHSPGKYERMAGADAVKPARNVMAGALGAQSEMNAAALQRTLDLFGPDSVEPVGPVLVENLTTMGAARAGLEALMSEGSRSDLAPLLAKLDACIVEIGIRAGRCKGIPDAVLRDKTSGKLCDAVAEGKKVMLECAGKVGGRELLRGIAQAILPRSIREAIQDRLSTSADKFVGPVSAERLMEVLQAQGADKLEQRIVDNLENGGAESLNAAILNVLKTAECVIQGEPGGAQDAPAASNLPHDAPNWVRDEAAKGSPILYNVVSNDGSARSQCSHNCGAQLEHVRNLVNDAREDAFERGRLTEVVRFQEHHIDRLQRELQAARELNGKGEVRDGRFLRDRPDSASLAVYPLDEVLGLIPSLDVGQFPVDRTHAGVGQVDNSELAPQSWDQLNNASNNALPPDSALDQIKPDDRARAVARNQTGGTDRIEHSTHQQRDQVHNPSNGVIPPDGSLERTPDQGNGEGLVRRELVVGDRAERSNRPPPQNLLQGGSNGVVPPDDDLGDIPPLDNGRSRANLQSDDTDRTDSSIRRDYLQQLGDAQLLVQRPSGRLDPSGAAPFDDNAVVGEFERYLQALGREQTPRRRDPLQPFGPRNMVSNGDAEPSIKASDFPEYRDARALMSGDSFIPFSTGRVGVPVDTVKPELVKLIDKHGPGNLSPKHVLEETRLRPAKATPVAIRSPDTELDRAFASMRKKRMEALYPATTPTAHAEPPRSPSPQPASSPAAQPTGAGSIGSLLSFANAVQSSNRVGPTRADILAGSRAPRGEQRSQVGDDQGLQLARATPTVARAVAQVVRNSDEESQPRLGVDARGQAKRAASSGSSSSRSSSSGSSDGGALEEWWTGIAERSSTHEAVQAWQRASFGEASPAPTDAQPQPDEGSVDGSLRALERTFDAVTSARSIHEAALEQFVRMVVTNPAGDGPEEPYTWSSGREPVVALQGEVSADSADSGNESPTRPKDDNWTLRPAKPIANTAMGQPIKQLRPTRMDLSFLNVSQVEEQDPTTGAPPRRVAHDEHHEHVIRSVSQSIADETPVTLWSTQPPLHPFLKSEPFVDTSGPEARMNALIQELKESFQKRAVARAAS